MLAITKWGAESGQIRTERVVHHSSSLSMLLLRGEGTRNGTQHVGEAATPDNAGEAEPVHIPFMEGGLGTRQGPSTCGDHFFRCEVVVQNPPLKPPQCFPAASRHNRLGTGPPMEDQTAV